MEKWVRIDEAVWYDVNNRAEVRSRKTGRILKPRKNKQGVEMVNLRDGGLTITRSTEALRKKAFG